MFDFKLALVILLCAIPGLVLTIPGRLRKYKHTISLRLSEGKRIPPMPVLAALLMLQQLLLVGGFAFLGAFIAPRVNLLSPFFSAIAHGTDIIESLPDPVPVLLLSMVGSVLFILIYYLVFRRWLDDKTAIAIDELRNESGIISRLLYGGIVEEIISRWGIMTMLVWFFTMLPFLSDSISIWLALIISGVILGLDHSRICLSSGCRKSIAFYTTEIVLYLWMSILFGYLYWMYGLLSVMISHMMFHLIWYPIDLAMLTRHRRAILLGGKNERFYTKEG